MEPMVNVEIQVCQDCEAEKVRMVPKDVKEQKETQATKDLVVMTDIVNVIR